MPRLPWFLREDAANLSRGAVLVIRRRLHDYRHAAGRVTFINDLVEMGGLHAFAGAPLNRTLDVVVRHALAAGSLDGAAQTGVAVRDRRRRFWRRW